MHHNPTHTQEEHNFRGEEKLFRQKAEERRKKSAANLLFFFLFFWGGNVLHRYLSLIEDGGLVLECFPEKRKGFYLLGKG